MRWQVVSDVRASVAVRGGRRMLAITAELDAEVLQGAGASLDALPSLLGTVGSAEGVAFDSPWAQLELTPVADTLSYVDTFEVPDSVRVGALSLHVQLAEGVGMVPADAFLGRAVLIALPAPPEADA